MFDGGRTPPGEKQSNLSYGSAGADAEKASLATSDDMSIFDGEWSTDEEGCSALFACCSGSKPEDQPLSLTVLDYLYDQAPVSDQERNPDSAALLPVADLRGDPIAEAYNKVFLADANEQFRYQGPFFPADGTRETSIQTGPGKSGIWESGSGSAGAQVAEGSYVVDGRSKYVFRTESEKEVLVDGYRWRKYGKKFIKNSPYKRNYFRCSEVGCFVKKRVERDREKPSYVLTTYEGKHTHNPPGGGYY